MKWWEIYSERQYVQLRTFHRPKIFIWYSGRLPDRLQNELRVIFENVEYEYREIANFIVSLVHVDRDPELQQLFGFLNPTPKGLFLTGYSSQGTTLFKCNELSPSQLKMYILRLLASSQN